MICKRLIFTLLIQNDQFCLSRNFKLQQVGGIDWFLNSYHAKSIFESIDELIILNVSSEDDSIEIFFNTVQDLTKYCFMPVAVGGNINSLDRVKYVFSNCGVDKVVFNTALFENPKLIEDVACIYGEQSIIASIDYKLINGAPMAFYNKGAKQDERTIEEVIRSLSAMPLGELYITSIDKDGTGCGYDMETVKLVCKNFDKPVIVSGGVGQYHHLYEGLRTEKVTGASTANLFNFIGDGLQKARHFLQLQNIHMAEWNF